MDEEAALALLTSPKAHERLAAARYLARCASSKSYNAISNARQTESDRWVRASLGRAIDRLASSIAQRSIELVSDDEDEDSSLAIELRSQAVQDVTNLLLHEATPIIGALRQRATTEVPNFAASQTASALHRLDTFLDAVDGLNRAASPARRNEFDLAALLRDISDEDELLGHIETELTGTTPLIVIGDTALVRLIVSNGLRNAIEATEAVPTGEKEPVLINWGDTDRDTWISILDRGIGLPPAHDRVFEIGLTTKSKDRHLGMGLALARQAADSLGGSLTLRPRDDAGVAFELRWPHTPS
ncbi:MAG: sensor histidine kinase [Dehalococcoidia bacterium]